MVSTTVEKEQNQCSHSVLKAVDKLEDNRINVHLHCQSPQSGREPQNIAAGVRGDRSIHQWNGKQTKKTHEQTSKQRIETTKNPKQTKTRNNNPFCSEILKSTIICHLFTKTNNRFFLYISYYYYSQLLYSAILCSRADSLHTLACDSEWLTVSFLARIINIHGSGVLVALCGCCMAGATWNAAVSAQVLCTPFNHAPGYSVTLFKAT